MIIRVLVIICPLVGFSTQRLFLTMTKPSGIQTRSAQRLGKTAHASTSSKLTPIGITKSIPNHGNQNEYPKRHLPSPRLNSPKSEPVIEEDCKYKTRYHYQQSHHLKPSLANSHLKQLHTRGYIVLKNKVRWQPKDIQQFIK